MYISKYHKKYIIFASLMIMLIAKAITDQYILLWGIML